MRRYAVASSLHQADVSFEDDGRMKVNGLSVDADIKRLGPTCFSVVLDGRSVSVVIERSDDLYHVLLGSTNYEFSVESERDVLLKMYEQEVESVHHRLEIHAPMPALVVKVEVEVGQEVLPDQGLLILEAMKMENELRSHQAGRVRDVCVNRGDTVEKGQLLIVME